MYLQVAIACPALHAIVLLAVNCIMACICVLFGPAHVCGFMLDLNTAATAISAVHEDDVRYATFRLPF